MKVRVLVEIDIYIDGDLDDDLWMEALLIDLEDLEEDLGGYDWAVVEAFVIEGDA